MGEKKKLKAVTVLGLFIPILMAGLRYKVGTDYDTYIAYIKDIAWHGGFSIQQYMTRFSHYLEPTFYILAQLVILLKHYQMIFMIYGTVSVIFLYKSIKKLELKQWPLIYFLVLLIIFPMSFNLMRQFTAITMAMYATVMLRKNYTKKFFLFTTLASLVHISAVINVFIYIIYKTINYKKHSLNRNQKIALAAFAIIASAAFISYGLSRYGYLLQYSKVTANLNFIPKLLMMVIIIGLRYKAPSIWNENKLFVMAGVVSITLGVVGFFIPYSDRISLYFFPFVLAMLPVSIYQIVPKNKKYLAIAIVVVVGLFYFIASYYILGSHQIMPYRTILG